MFEKTLVFVFPRATQDLLVQCDDADVFVLCVHHVRVCEHHVRVCTRCVLAHLKVGAVEVVAEVRVNVVEERHAVCV